MSRAQPSDADHGPHLGEPTASPGSTPRSVHRTRIPWRIAYLVGLAVVTTSLFLLVPDRGSVALLVLLGGLMAAGRISDPQERRFLKERLEGLERRLASKP